MNTCLVCAAEFSASGKEVKLCPDCRRKKLETTWIRQMRAYGAAIFVGLLMVGYAFSQFKTGGFSMSEAPISLFAILAFGGLGLMGGLFGLALALFFSMWHKKSN